MTTVTLKLTPRQLALLDLVSTVYLEEGGPAWECAQEWNDAFTPEEIEGLATAINQGVDNARNKE
jgi:hypothetical protein